MNDESIMPIGKYKGEKIANVPAEYLLWMYENANLINRSHLYGELRDYIKDNLDVLKAEIEYKNKSK
jgi:uncharacterized protein (DUF3820 family)